MFTVPNPFTPGQQQTIVVPAGGQIIIVPPLIHIGNNPVRNPHHFEDPNSYKPFRYGQMNEAENIAGFSIGARVCPGRKFALTEAICFLTSLLRDWRVDPILRDGETRQGWRDRVIEAKLGLTLGIKNAPLRFVRRKGSTV